MPNIVLIVLIAEMLSQEIEMRAKEIFGQRIKDNIRYINLHRYDDADLARMIIRVAREVETEQGMQRDDLLGAMYGRAVDANGEDLDDAEQRARIASIQAKTTKDLADAIKSDREQSE